MFSFIPDLPRFTRYVFKRTARFNTKENKQEFETRAEINIGGNPNGSNCPITNGKNTFPQNQFIYILVISSQDGVDEHEMNKICTNKWILRKSH